MTLSPAPVQASSHVGMACHLCGGALHSDCDPKRKGWLSCSTCGPVYMPLRGKMVRVRVGCSLEEASRRGASVIVALNHR